MNEGKILVFFRPISKQQILLSQIDTFQTPNPGKSIYQIPKNEACSILKKVFERKTLKISNKHFPSKRKHAIVNRFPQHLQSTLSVCNTSTDKSTSFYPTVTYNLQLLSPKNTYKSTTFSLPKYQILQPKNLSKLMSVAIQRTQVILHIIFQISVYNFSELFTSRFSHLNVLILRIFFIHCDYS